MEELAKVYVKFIEDVSSDHGNDVNRVAYLAQALWILHREGAGLISLWKSPELPVALVQLHGRIVRAAISLSSNAAPTFASTSTSAPAPLPSSYMETADPMLHTYRQLLTAAQLSLGRAQEANISRRHSVALAVLRSDSLHCFSKLVASDFRQLQLAMDALRGEEALLSTTCQHQEQQQHSPDLGTPVPPAPASPRPAGARQHASSAAPSDTLLPHSQQHALAARRQEVQRRRLCLYHSAEEAASLLLLLLNSVSRTTGTSTNCGCQLCAGHREKGNGAEADRGQAVRAGKATIAGGPEEGGGGINTRNSASAGSGSAGSSSSSSCLLLAVWRALHEGGLVEQLVAGVLLLFGQQKEGAGTGGGGSSSSSAGEGYGVTDGVSLFGLGGLAHVGQGEQTDSRGPAGTAGPSRVTQGQMAMEELRVYAAWSRLHQEACREYCMQPGQEALRMALRSLSGGMLLPDPDHPAWPHVVACLSRPGCRLAAAASMVAAVCAEDGGPTYGLELGPLLAAAGGVPLVAAEEALAAAGGDVERPVTVDLRFNRVDRLRNTLSAWRMRCPPAAEAKVQGLCFTSRLCNRVLAVCIRHAGLAGGEPGAQPRPRQREAGYARLEGTATAAAARAEGFRLLADAEEAEVAGLAVQALVTLAWATRHRGARGARGEVRGAAAAAAAGGEQGRGEEEELGARAVEGGQGLPVWWWRKALQVLPLLMARSASGADWAPELVAHRKVLHTRTALPRKCTFPAIAPPDVSHPLTAGLLPALEHWLTPDRTARLAARDGVSGLQVAGALVCNLLGCRPDWGWLLAYADPQEAASFMRTCAQLLMHHVEQLEGQLSTEVSMSSLRQLAESLSQVLLAACAPSMQAVGAYAGAIALGATSARAKCGPWAVLCTSPRCPHCSPGAPWHGDPGSGSSGGSSRGRAGSSAGDGGGSSRRVRNSSGAAEAAAFCPGRRVATNVSSALLHLLPALTHTVYRVAERGRTQWAADAAGSFVAALVPLCARVHADADAERELQKHNQQRHERQHKGQMGQPSVSGGYATPESQDAGVEDGVSGVQDWNGRAAAAGAGANCSPDAGPSCASAPGPRSWREVLLALDPIRLLKLQLRSGREPYVMETGSVLSGLAVALTEKLGEAIRGDKELCDLLAIRGLKASPATRREYVQLALVLEPCKALEVLYGRLGLTAAHRAAMSWAKGADSALAPLLVNHGDVVGLGQGLEARVL